MSKQAARAQRAQVWLEHLRRCEAAGNWVASYTKEHGIPTWALYQWRTRLSPRRVMACSAFPAKDPEVGPGDVRGVCGCGMASRHPIYVRCALSSTRSATPWYSATLRSGCSNVTRSSSAVATWKRPGPVNC